MIRFGLVAFVITALAAAAQVANPHLAAPKPLHPTANEDVPEPVVFEWTGVQGAAGYIIEILRNAEGAALIHAEVSAPRLIINSLPQGRLWWRVRAVDAAKAVGPWSPAVRFRPMMPPLASSVFSVAIVPASVPVGAPCDGLVTIEAAAPEGGVSVSLTSSDAAIAAVPDHVVIPAGTKSAPFKVTTGETRDNATVRIVASGSAGPVSTSLVVKPAAPAGRILSLSLHPLLLASGGTAVGTVTLTNLAPSPNGVEVQLSADDSSLITVPATVTVPPGQLVASFRIQGGYTTIAKEVNITATAGAQSTAAMLRLRSAGHAEPLPAPGLEAPANGATVNGSGIVVFRWSPVAHAAAYTIQLDTVQTFDSQEVLERTVPEGELRLGPLAPQRFWWRVRATDEYGAPGKWSSGGSFQLEQ